MRNVKVFSPQRKQKFQISEGSVLARPTPEAVHLPWASE